MNDISDVAFVEHIRSQIATAIAALRDAHGDANIDAIKARSFSETLQDELLSTCDDPRLQQLIIRTLAKELDDAAQTLGIAFPRRRLHLPPKPPVPLRRNGWQQSATFAFACWDRLHHHLDRRGKGLCDQDLSGLILASAILRGLMLRPAAWPAFLGELARGGPQLQSTPILPDLPWFELDLPLTSGQFTNHSREKERLRVFPDVVTLGLLRQWQQGRHQLPKPPSSASAALSLMARALFVDAPACPAPALFASAAMVPWEDEMTVALPYALTAIANGEITGFSADTPAWRNLLDVGHIAQKSAPLRSGRRRIVHDQGDAGSYGATSPAEALSSLRRALDRQADAARKQTTKPVEHALNALPDRSLTPAGRALRAWYLHLLHARRKVSTLQRYHAAIAQPLLATLAQDDPRRMSAGEFEDRIEQITAHPEGIVTPYAIARLAQFISFSAASPLSRWPMIDPVLFGGSTENRRPCVRTALVSAQKIRHALDFWPSGDPRLREVECAAFLLAVRGGLRISELEALTVADVTPGEQGGVLVHSTSWADIKSSAGRRKVPVQLLAESNEALFLDAFFVRRLREANSSREQLLSTGTALLGRKRFDRDGFGQRLRQIMGQTPHDLRHAALSNLALLLIMRGAQANVLRQLFGWSIEKQTSIRQRILGMDPDPRMTLNRLAQLAGHSRPETTIRSYMHLSDLALGLVLRSNPEAHPAMRITRWLRLNRRSLQLSGETNAHPIEDARRAVLANMEQKALAANVENERTKENAIGLPSPPLGPALALRVLSDLARRTPVEDISAKFSLRPEQIHVVATAARRLMGNRLVPILPRSSEHRRHVERLMDHLAQLDPVEARAWALQTIRAARKSHFCFATKRQFETWRSIVGQQTLMVDWQCNESGRYLHACPITRATQRPVSTSTFLAPAILCLCAQSWNCEAAKQDARGSDYRQMRAVV